MTIAGLSVNRQLISGRAHDAPNFPLNPGRWGHLISVGAFPRADDSPAGAGGENGTREPPRPSGARPDGPAKPRPPAQAPDAPVRRAFPRRRRRQSPRPQLGDLLVRCPGPHLGDAQVGDRYPDQSADLIVGEQLGLASQARPSSGMGYVQRSARPADRWRSASRYRSP